MEEKMRIAVMIILIALVVFVGFQSCALGFVGTVSENETMSDNGSSGIFIALLFVFAAAFAIKFPIVSMIIFVIIALIAFPIAKDGIYKDMYVWSWLSIILAVMSFFGNGELKKKKRQKELE
jgi:4-amino-4-deoxy-L-arabinose transferase-like glycosyltransferase